jgi:LPXTG-motif cell wall-anchored protein
MGMMSAAAFADAPTTPTAPTTGTITVNPNNDGQTYTLYKLFDAQISFKESSGQYEQEAITYTVPTGKSLSEDNQWFKINANGFVETKGTLADSDIKSAEFIAWAKTFGTPNETVITANGNNDPAVKWENLPFGYYFVDSTLGSFVGIDSNNPNITIKDKNDAPKVDKSITGVKGPGEQEASTATLGIGDDKTDVGAGANEKAIAQVGDTVSYKVVVKAKPGAENYAVTDTMENLALVANSLKINDSTYNDSTIVDKSNSSVVNGASTYTLKFTKIFLDTISTNTDIIITYDAIITGTAVDIGEDNNHNGNTNTVTLTYGHKATPDSSTDSANVYTAKISVIKNDGNQQGLAGAEFALKNSAKKYYSYNSNTGIVTWVDSVESATKYTSNSDGKLNGDFKGLSDGSYTLEETVTPTGYNKINADHSSLQFTIDANDYTNDNLIQSSTVINNAGTELPSTGGIGTTIFYIVGGVMVAGAVVFLLTKRRMAGNE